MRARHSTGTKIGLIGPAGDLSVELERAVSLLLSDPLMREVIYLGDDRAVEQIPSALQRGLFDQDEFLRRGAALACSDADDAIFELLADARKKNRMPSIRKLPDAPARAIEMMDKWLVLIVYDKAVLDEDDIANAHVIIYGRADEAGFKRFGPRCFFTPGPLSGLRIGCLELISEAHLCVHLLDLDGKPVASEALHASGGKVVVTV